MKVTKRITEIAHAKNILVEAELGRLTGKEDDTNVEEYEEKLTDPDQVCAYDDYQQLIYESVVKSYSFCHYFRTLLLDNGEYIMLDIISKFRGMNS